MRPWPCGAATCLPAAGARSRSRGRWSRTARAKYISTSGKRAGRRTRTHSPAQSRTRTREAENGPRFLLVSASVLAKTYQWAGLGDSLLGQALFPGQERVVHLAWAGAWLDRPLHSFRRDACVDEAERLVQRLGRLV